LDQQNNFWDDLLALIFRFSFFLFLVLFAIDFVLPGFVTNYFNPIWLLLIALVSGIIFSIKK
jgi:hypothetical protein